MSDSSQSSAEPTGRPGSGEPIHRLSLLWRAGRPPNLKRFLSDAGDLSHSELVAILRLDLCDRWRRGDRVPAENYLRDHLPGMAESEAAIDLIYQEFLLREELQEAPTYEEYQRRFPNLAEQLRQQFEFHRALETKGGAGAPPKMEEAAHSPLNSAFDPTLIVGLTEYERRQLRLQAPFGVKDAGLATTTGIQLHSNRNQSQSPLNLPIIPGNEVQAALGRYTIEKLLGEGGMGSVWIAKQSEPVKRRVALKLIKTGLDSSSVVRRFETERQALAVMDHPNIARVFDGGLLPDGRPYFAMEFIDGLPINKFCDDAKLGTRERLELFVKVCQAVQHAHQKGIIHRDLKPANVLVTKIDGKAEPKVIDFGVAKAVGGKLSDRAETTQFGAVVGTLEYMAPEQAGFSGSDVDTRADVYALGVVLYELLTGLRPFDSKRLHQASLDEVIRIIREEEPIRPSTRLSSSQAISLAAAARHTEPNRLLSSIRGDLDWIVMKCLEKDRNRRYETANGLASDVLRHLSDEAVLASPPSASYQLKKFLRRHRGPVVAAGVVTIALVAGVIGTTLGLFEATRQTDLARIAATRAEKASDRTREVLDAMVSGVTGDSLTTQKAISPEQRKFLSEVLTYYREFAGEKADDEKSRFRTANAAAQLGRIESRLGRTQQGITAYQMARDGFQTLVADFPKVPNYRSRLAQNHNDLGNVLSDLDRQREALDQYRQALAIQEKLSSEFPAAPNYRRELALCHNNLGALLVNLGESVEAEKQHQRAFAIHKKMVVDFPATPECREDLANCHSSLGALFIGLGRRRQAEEQDRQALEILNSLLNDFPDSPAYRSKLSQSHHRLANLVRAKGDISAADEHNRQAAVILEKLVAEFPTVPDYQINLGGCYCDFGNAVKDGGRVGNSIDWFNKAIATLSPMHRAEPRHLEAKKYLRNSHASRAMAFDVLSKHSEALKDWDRAVELSPLSEKLELRARRAASQFKASLFAESVAEVADLTKSSKWRAPGWYNFACVYAVASVKIAGKKAEYSDRAMELLRQAVKAGWNNAAQMKKDADLDSLRNRADFKKLLAEIEKKAPAESKKKL